MSQGRSRRKFSGEFKQEAVALSRQPGMTVKRAAADLARAQVGTIRVKLLKLAVRVVTSVRRVVFHLSSAYPYQALFRLLVVRLTAS